MDRDARLTGFLRGQTDSAQAPAGFELNNPWKVWSISETLYEHLLTRTTAGEAFLLGHLSVVFVPRRTKMYISPRK